MSKSTIECFIVILSHDLWAESLIEVSSFIHHKSAERQEIIKKTFFKYYMNNRIYSKKKTSGVQWMIIGMYLNKLCAMECSCDINIALFCIFL